MNGKKVAMLLASVAILAAGLASVASGAGSANRPARVSEYPLMVVVTKTDPKRPQAGKPFTALIGILNQDTGEPVQTGDVACPARVGHRGLRMMNKDFMEGSGIAGCTWMIPARSGRKHMVAKVEVYSDEGTVRSQFLRVIRP